jgi:aspartate/methionine/tyrosine aminotransferase
MPYSLPVNPNLVEMEYAVRGPIPQRAAELKKQGRRIIPCHIGNPQALGQRPLTWVRQVMSLLEEPGRIGRERALKQLAGKKSKALAGLGPEARVALGANALLDDQVLATAEDYLVRLESGVGAYTESKGPLFIREHIARFIDRRDSVKPGSPLAADPERIFLTDGASTGARSIIELLIAAPGDGIMIPIPQYPLYSATLKRQGGELVGYYPDEDAGWALDRNTLEESLAAAGARGVKVKAIVVINPGNPTGAILDEKSGREVVAFAAQHGLAIIADEVYQENLYGADWISFARLVGEQEVPLFSLHSVSKGYFGECGHRGGYFEVRHEPRIAGSGAPLLPLLLKQASVNLCSNTMGQALTYLMVTPPEEGTPARERYEGERRQILDDLLAKATLIREAFGRMEGVRSFGRIGALYLFPRLERLPQGTDDFAYCMNLLEATGLCTVNGAGFGQREGTQHLRIAFLPPKEMLAEVLPAWIEWHNGYVKDSGH